MKRAASKRELSTSLSSGASFCEKRIAFYLKKYFEIQENARIEELGGKELDIYIPSMKTGIEYDGRNWHDYNDDEKKNTLCSKAGIELIRIREEGMGEVEGVKNYHVIHYEPDSYNKAIAEIITYLSQKEGKSVEYDIDVERDDTEIQAFYIDWQMKNSFANLHEDVAKEWDYEKNLGLRPEQYSEHSNFKVWWKCGKGHSWKAAINNRVSFGSRCPVCSGKKVLKGFNDLATLHPESKLYWDYDKNEKGPEDYTEFSEKRVYWRCPNGHEWEWDIGNFSKRVTISKFICPECPRPLIKEGKKSLRDDEPDYLKEWAYDLNTYVRPEDVSRGSAVSVWWRCERGHVWESTIANRSNGQGCPVCSGNRLEIGYNDLETRYPSIAKEWDTKRNSISAKEIFPGTVKKYWWICPKGHSYQASPNKRTSDNTACPYCSNHKLMKGFNDLATTNPELLKEWDYEKNEGLDPGDTSKGSSKKVWWICPKGHSYYSRISNRAILHRGCPICNGKQILPGYNDLATIRPDLVKEWHSDLNNGLLPTEVTPHSRKEAWWVCDNGHVWKTAICNRTAGSGCPVCANKKRGRHRVKKINQD
ncbi:MAG: hypothetical protein E7Z64_01835 [Thermoplasmata archaeon]|nr:hypothetical protein [Thermoplasmata archaeon]